MSRRRTTETTVLAEAGRLFASQGLEGTSVRDIAAAAGVSVGTVVSVGTKNELFIASMEELATGGARRALDTGADPREELRTFVATSAGLTQEGAVLTRDYLTALLSSSPTAANRARLGSVLDDLTRVWGRHLGLSDDSPHAALAARSFYLSLVGAVFAVACGQLARRDAIDVLNEIIDEAGSREGSQR